MAVNPLATSVIPYAFPDLPGIRCVFTTRLTGNLSLYRTAKGNEDHAAAVAARRALLDAAGLETWSEVHQVHGDEFITDPEPTPVATGPAVAADGMGTARKKHALCIKTADCQPILLAHPKGAVAAIHVGWRGNAAGFPQSAVARFCLHYGLDPADVRAVRGPSLGRAEFVNFAREWPASFAPWYNQASQCMDLWSLTRQQLCEAGLKPDRVHGLDMCTLSLNSLFFSHRAGDTGRQAGIIWME